MLNKLKEQKKKNKEERIEFVKFWAGFVKTNKNETWSKQQADFINSVMNGNYLKLKPELYLKVKSKVKSRLTKN